MALPKNGLWKHSAREAAADRSHGSHSDLNTKSFGPIAKWQRQLKDCLNRIYIGNEVMYTFGIKSLVGNITCNKLREKNIYIY